MFGFSSASLVFPCFSAPRWRQIDFMDIEKYKAIRGGGAGFYEQPRGLIAVWGKEAVQFLDGMITNDMKTLADGGSMLAAFPNAQGRLIAVVRVLREGERFLFETEEATREKLFQNLFRFTFAGDFFVEDLSGNFKYFELIGPKDDVYNPGVDERFAGAYAFESPHGADYFIPNELEEEFREFLVTENGCADVDDELYETLRIEAGIPLYGVDMDETTIVPELGLPEMISYTKGCYVGQEIIARIHFRGHVAKRLAGLVLEDEVTIGQELASAEGKAAGRVISITFSPGLKRWIALAYVRYEFLAAGTELRAGEIGAVVSDIPFDV